MEFGMRTTVSVDDDLIDKAREFSGIEENAALIREGLKALVEREAARRLIRLGGSQPGLKLPPRRRSKLA
jgi:Arc/MetJ family transcription regulator